MTTALNRRDPWRRLSAGASPLEKRHELLSRRLPAGKDAGVERLRMTTALKRRDPWRRLSAGASPLEKRRHVQSAGIIR
jgi:hypothetical protein